MIWVFFVTLFLSFHIKAEVTLQDSGEVFVNNDFYKQKINYNVQGNINTVKFVSEEDCKVLTSELKSDSIPLVIWEFATEMKCVQFSEVISQIVPSSPSLIIFTTSQPRFPNNYYSIRNEPYGELEYSIPCTLISSHTASILNETSPLVHVTTELAVIEQVENSVAFKVYAWFFFSVWVILFFHAAFQFVLIIKQKFPLLAMKTGIFICGLYVSIVRCIELSVDPQKSTGKLGREGESFLWWSAFLAGYFLFSILLIAWIQVAGIDRKFISGKSTKRSIYFVYALMVACTVVLLGLAFIPGTSMASVILYACTIPFLIALLILFLYYGITVYKALNRMDSGNSDDRNTVLRKITLLMISCLIGCVVLLIVVSFVSALLFGIIGVNVPTVIFFLVLIELTLLEMTITVYISVSFRNFGKKSTTTTSVGAMETTQRASKDLQHQGTQRERSIAHDIVEIEV